MIERNSSLYIPDLKKEVSMELSQVVSIKQGEINSCLVVMKNSWIIDGCVVDGWHEEASPFII